MYAIVKTGGMQFKVFPNETVRVPRLEVEEGKKVTLSEVLLLHDDDQTMVGTPKVAGAKVTAEVLSHGKADKVVVFKMKRRKNFRRNRGHRQDYTELLIKEVMAPKKK
jgi:large subunit ribosomal protein L21